MSNKGKKKEVRICDLYSGTTGSGIDTYCTKPVDAQGNCPVHGKVAPDLTKGKKR